MNVSALSFVNHCTLNSESESQCFALESSRSRDQKVQSLVDRV